MSTPTQTKAIKIDGMTCVGCALNVEKSVQKIGFDDARVNFASKELIINDFDKKSMGVITEAVEKAGFAVLITEKSATQKFIDKALVVFAGIVALYFIVAMLMMGSFHAPVVDAVLATIVLGIGLWKFGLGAIKSARSGMANMYVLILLGAITAYLYSFYLWVYYPGSMLYFETTAVIIALVMVGNWIEEISIEKATTSLGELANKQIKDANKWIDGKIQKVSVNSLKVGDEVQVNTGDLIPTDGIVLSGDASVNESLLTGESEPLHKSIQAALFGGSLVSEGQIKYTVSKPVHLSALSKINELVQKASSEKAEIQNYADKISAIFVPGIIAIAAIWFLVSYFIMGLAFEPALIRSIAILVVSCPCAMGLATPISVMVGLGKLSKEGILAKGSKTFENFAAVEHLLVDKTGTITTGEFTVSNLWTKDDNPEITSIIKTMEAASSHPIAQSVVKHFANEATYNFNSVIEVKGKGMEAKDAEGKLWKLGNLVHANVETDKIFDIYLSCNDELIAGFDIQDELKPQVAETLKYFTDLGIQPVMLSGDNERKVTAIADLLNIRAKGNLQPEDKLKEIDNYIVKPTAMVGDGINDAPALSKVNVGISFSGASNITVQNADLVLMQDDIYLLTKAHKIASLTLKTIKQNLFWAFAYNLVAVPMAMFGILSPILAAFFMLFSDLVVIGNAYLLKLKKID